MMMPVSGIYLIENQINKKFYIGSAVNIFKRTHEHIRALRKGCHHNNYLQRAWNKYSENSFFFKTILYCDRKDLILFEQRTIDIFKLKHTLYNLSPTAGSTLGRNHTEETKLKIGDKSRGRNIGRKHTKEEITKMSIANKGKNTGKCHSEESRQKISKVHKGRRFSEEHKAKISASLCGHDVSEETREKLRIANIGKIVLPETRAKISANSKGSKLGRKLSQKTRKKMSLSHIGMKMSDETKAKISLARKAYWRNKKKIMVRYTKGWQETDEVPGWVEILDIFEQ